jgi:hypothetical protein
MNSVRCLSLMRHTAVLGAAFAFALGSASAQAVSAADDSAAYSSSNTVSSTESSSNTLQLADSASLADASLPAAPRAPGSGGGQYDNRSRGGGGTGGVRSHLTYEVGGGFNAPTEDSAQHISWGGNITVGAGYRFNQNASLMVEYQFIDSKLPGQIIAEAAATGGHVHIWSLTLDPVIDLTPKSAVDLYLVGGGGFYRSVTSFTDPQQQQYCTYFYCGVVTQNVVVGHYSSNQGGWNGGLGIAHRFAGWNGDGKMKVFAEARYLNVLTPSITTQANGLGTTSVDADTRIIPVTVGVRW